MILKHYVKWRLHALRLYAHMIFVGQAKWEGQLASCRLSGYEVKGDLS